LSAVARGYGSRSHILRLRGDSDIVFVVDDDAIAANERRHSQFIGVLRRVVAEMAARRYGTLTYRTTTWPDRNLFMEDVCSIPDLAAGTVMAALRSSRSPDGNARISAKDLDARSRPILTWLLGDSRGLTRLVAIVDPATRPNIASVRLPKMAR
jgi:hypothetical protein